MNECDTAHAEQWDVRWVPTTKSTGWVRAWCVPKKPRMVNPDTSLRTEEER